MNCWVALEPTPEAAGAPSCIKDCRSFWPASISGVLWADFGILVVGCCVVDLLHQSGLCSDLKTPFTCCGGTSVQDPLKMQGCVTCCFPFCKEALNLTPSQDHVKTRMPLYQHSICNLVRASHIPRSLLFNVTMCYKLRIWGGMKAASPSIHPHTKLHGAATAYNNNNNKKRGQGNIWACFSW